MEKIKIKLTNAEAAEICQVVDAYIVTTVGVQDFPRKYADQVVVSSLRQTLSELFEIANKAVTKPVTRKITVSEGLIFFGLFNGVDFGDSVQTKIAFRNMCRQIENYLFIKGEYKLPTKGEYNG